MFKKTLLAASATALGLAITPVNAADLGGPVMHAPPRVIQAPIDVGGGWYLRGDVGVGAQGYRSFQLRETTPLVPQAVLNNFGPLTYSHTSPMIAGVGIGYQFNEWLRLDLTAEYRGAARFSQDVATGLLTGPGGQGRFGNRFTGNISSIVTMANAYADLGNFYGIIPFVGVGAGFAMHRVHGLTDTGIIYPACDIFTMPNSVEVGGMPVCTRPNTPGYGFAASRNSTTFAWALHAGLGYAVNEALRLEISYRYLNLGNVNAGTVNCMPDCGGFGVRLRNVSSHDIRIGMRWMLSQPPVAVAAPVRPVIARN
jgi:opacity protein-like surface antigen